MLLSQTKVWTKKLHSMIMGRTIDGTSAGQIELEVKKKQDELNRFTRDYNLAENKIKKLAFNSKAHQKISSHDYPTKIT